MSTRLKQVHNERTHTNPERNKPNYTGRRIGAGILLLAAGSGVVGTANFANDVLNKDYDYSQSTHAVVAKPGMGLQAVAKTVETTGDPADLRDIAQYLKDTNPNLENGLQEGEEVIVPDTAEVS